MIIDAHAHIFPTVKGKTAEGSTRSVGYGRIAVGNRIIQLIPPFCKFTQHSPEMLIAHMDFTGVDRAVLLQGPFYGECNSYVVQAVKKYPNKFSAMAYFDPWSQNAFEHFKLICRSGIFRGIKIEFSVPTGFSGIYKDIRLDSDELEWLWYELEARKLVINLDLGAVGSPSYRTNEVRRIAERHPGLNMVIAHLGQPVPALDNDRDLYYIWETQLKLAKMPNVWFDTASLMTYFQGEENSFEIARKYFMKAVELTGTEKIMFGSDIPGTLIHVSYYQQRLMMELFLKCMDRNEREKILGGNAWKVYFESIQ